MPNCTRISQNVTKTYHKCLICFQHPGFFSKTCSMNSKKQVPKKNHSNEFHDFMCSQGVDHFNRSTVGRHLESQTKLTKDIKELGFFEQIQIDPKKMLHKLKSTQAYVFFGTAQSLVELNVEANIFTVSKLWISDAYNPRLKSLKS